MVSFESDTHPLSECVNPVASNPAQIVEINCALLSQHAITIVTLQGREHLSVELCDAFTPELRHL